MHNSFWKEKIGNQPSTFKKYIQIKSSLKRKWKEAKYCLEFLAPWKFNDCLNLSWVYPVYWTHDLCFLLPLNKIFPETALQHFWTSPQMDFLEGSLTINYSDKSQEIICLITDIYPMSHGSQTQLPMIPAKTKRLTRKCLYSTAMIHTSFPKDSPMIKH